MITRKSITAYATMGLLHDLVVDYDNQIVVAERDLLEYTNNLKEGGGSGHLSLVQLAAEHVLAAERLRLLKHMRRSLDAMCREARNEKLYRTIDLSDPHGAKGVLP